MVPDWAHLVIMESMSGWVFMVGWSCRGGKVADNRVRRRLTRRANNRGKGHGEPSKGKKQGERLLQDEGVRARPRASAWSVEMKFFWINASA